MQLRPTRTCRGNIYTVPLNFTTTCAIYTCRVSTLSRCSHQRRSIERRTHSCNFIKKETVAQVFSCEFCEIFKNTFFKKHLWMIASIVCNIQIRNFFCGTQVTKLTTFNQVYLSYRVRKL